jgi:hypothetical protein|tara:strand:- start:3786 stop:4436 length:651 start_codon:yes stop_codon:yes gene_type:complete
MAITHSNFLTQVRNYTEVDSNVLSDTLIDQFLRNTELDIAGKVDYDDLRKYATTSTIASQRYLSMPSDLIYLRSVQITNSGVRDFLEKRDTSFISEFNPSETEAAPKYYANWDDQNIVLAPTPNSAYTIQINYIIDPPHFTSTNNTFLSTYQDQLLLYGVLAECFSYLKGPMDMYKLYLDKYNESTQGFAMQQMGNRRRGQYEEGVPRIPIQSPSP